ncbi:MAG: hypothetical protein AB1540_02820 [Bdellovibrionota bacterium]
MKPSNVLLKSVVAGLVAFGVGACSHNEKTETSAAATDASSAKGSVECHGGNMCKAKGDCGGPGYSCAGNNQCMGKGWVTTANQAECDALKAKVQAAMKAKKSKTKKARQKS